MDARDYAEGERQRERPDCGEFVDVVVGKNYFRRVTRAGIEVQVVDIFQVGDQLEVFGPEGGLAFEGM